jgi:hypothetical protein
MRKAANKRQQMKDMGLGKDSGQVVKIARYLDDYAIANHCGKAGFGMGLSNRNRTHDTQSGPVFSTRIRSDLVSLKNRILDGAKCFKTATLVWMHDATESFFKHYYHRWTIPCGPVSINTGNPRWHDISHIQCCGAGPGGSRGRMCRN